MKYGSRECSDAKTKYLVFNYLNYNVEEREGFFRTAPEGRGRAKLNDQRQNDAAVKLQDF